MLRYWMVCGTTLLVVPPNTPPLVVTPWVVTVGTSWPTLMLADSPLRVMILGLEMTRESLLLANAEIANWRRALPPSRALTESPVPLACAL